MFLNDRQLFTVKIFKHSRIAWRPIFELFLVALLFVGGFYLLEWRESRDTEIAVQVVKNAKPEDGQVTIADIEEINNRLGCDVNTKSIGFRVTQIRGGGNDYNSYLNLKSCYVEADFLSAHDGTIVSAHDETDAGRCGLISQSTWTELRDCERGDGHKITTLSDFLRLPLSEWFIDLKATASDDNAYTISVIENAVDEIKNADRLSGAVLMIYNAPPTAVEIIKSNGIRAGLKGYPRTKEQVKGMIDTANRIGFEMTCVSEHLMDQDLLAYSKKMNIWQLPWTAARPNPERWQKIVDWGAGGLITAWVGWAEENLET